MIACFDVHYEKNTAYIACLVFKKWEDEEPWREYTMQVNEVEEYVPGQFYKRELPGLLACYEQVEEPLEYIVVDSFVWLGQDKKGMGAYLFEALYSKIPVIGVGKTNFRSAVKVKEVFRGGSKNPLYVTAAGIDVADAAGFVLRMHGHYRNPTLLKAVDRLCRTFWQ